MTFDPIAYKKQYYQENKERIKAKVKARALEKKEEIAATNKRRYQANKEQICTERRSYNLANPNKLMLIRSRERAKKLGIEHSITLEDIHIPDKCPIFGLHLESSKHHDCSPSLDRIDSSKGYTPGNVWVISNRANRIKNDATPDELIRLARAVAEKTAHELCSVPSIFMEVVITPGTY